MKGYLRQREKRLRILNSESLNFPSPLMKKIFFALSIVTCISVSSQKKYRNIINSTNITEIENFLREAHPEDSRRFVLKRKIVALKNASWMNSGKTKTYSRSSTNNAAFAVNSFANSVNKPSTFSSMSEEEEFQKLIAETSSDHKEKTVKLLNQLFDNDITNDKAILLIKNEGNCNMIIRIQGKEHYNVAVPARGENFVTLKKGEYKLSGNMCEARYYSTKSIAANTLVTLHKSEDTFSAHQTLSNNNSGVSN